MDAAQKKAGNPHSLSKRETQVNKRRTNVVRRQFDQSYLSKEGTKSALVTGDGLEPGS